MIRKKKKEHEEEKVVDHLSLTKHSLIQEVNDTKSQLTDTKSQHASALEKINTLSLVLHQALGHTSCALASDFVVTKWWTELTTLSMLMKSGSQICPVVVRITGYSEKKNNELRWYSDSFTLMIKDTRCAYLLSLLAMMMVKVLTCQCTCAS